MMTTLVSSLISFGCAAPDSPPTLEVRAGYADTVFDFVYAFSDGIAANALETSVSTSQSGGEAMQAIFQHPLNDGDARLTFDVALSTVGDDERLTLAFAIGLRDGVVLDDPATPVDGVLCGVNIGRHRVFEAVVHEPGWREFAVDLTPFAGKTVAISFTTNANGTSNYDWSLWGAPRIYRLSVVSDGTAPTRFASGIALVTGFDGQTTVRRFRLDRATAVNDAVANLLGDRRGEIAAKIELYALLPKIVIQSLSSTAHLLFTGKDYTVRCALSNVGEAPVEDFHQVAAGISGAALRRGRAERSVTSLGVGETLELTWQMRGMPRRDTVDVTVTVKSAVANVVSEATRTTPLRFQRALPPLPARTSNEVRTLIQSDYALLENEHVRVAFLENEGAYRHFLLFAQRGSHLQQVATCMPISRIVYLDSAQNVETLDFAPTGIAMGGSSDGDASLRLTGSETDVDGVVWDFDATFTLFDNSKRVLTDYRVRPRARRQLLHFAGPILRVGDGTDGEKKQFALFPGLEFLEGDEVSSSTRDAVPPINNRFAPHPYKITIPAMAVQQNDVVTGVLWDPLLPWGDGNRVGLSAMFSSPNRFDGQDNHLLGVFLPTIPEYVPENTTLAATSVDVAEEGIRLRAQIFSDPRGTILDVPDLWAEAYGFPKPADTPRSDEEEVLLSRHGFLVSTWDPETKKSRHCVGWAPANAPGFATLLWYDYLATGDSATRDRVELIAERTIAEQGPEALASRANCHILRWEFPFYYGYLDAGLRGAHAEVSRILDAQKDDGSWRFAPNNDKTRTLGEPGAAVLGTCAANAATVLKFARITGDDVTLQPGLKALAFMDRFTVPRGAQAWECPLHEPDILAAAWAIEAYLEAYAITDDDKYRERAEYWAKTGLPFLYYWNVPDRPGMRFGSIPVFGTTFFTHPWFGVPVQWNGLVYAYAIQHLSRHSEYPWSQIAEGIVVSAMHQQWTDGDLKGTYPDGFYEFCTVGRGPHINPEDIMVNLLALRGHDPDISTAVVRTQNGTRIHISSGARVVGAEIRGDTLVFELIGIPPYDALVFVGNLPQLTVVDVDGRRLDSGNSSGASRGWRYDSERRAAYLRVPQSKERIHVRLDLSAPHPEVHHATTFPAVPPSTTGETPESNVTEPGRQTPSSADEPEPATLRPSEETPANDDAQPLPDGSETSGSPETLNE
jgi:hypothetical protein